MFKFLANKIADTSVTEAVSEIVTEVSTEVASGIQLQPTTENMETALLWFVTGMVGVFAVIGVIVLSVTLLNKAGSGKKKD